MATYQVAASAAINAPAEQVYSIIADYHNGHPHILPKPFYDLKVEEGGIGAGTTIRFKIKAYGRVNDTYGVVTEPEPGRVLVESYPETNVVTSFTVTPLEQGRSHITITTDMPDKGGLLGALERFMVTRFLRGAYAEELGKLAALAEERSHSSARSDGT